MSTLTEAAGFSKKAFIWGIIGIAIIIGLFIFLGIARSVKNALFPKGPLPATVAFEKIPRIDLSSGFRPARSVNYTLETISGDLPTLPGMAKVFAIGRGESSFGALENIKRKADNLGFSENAVEVSPGVFEFEDPRNEGRILTIDSVSENMTLETTYISDVEIISTHPESEKRAIDMARNFLADYSLNLLDYPADKVETRKLRIDGSALTETPSIANANLVEVNFMRSDLDGLAVYWAKFNEAGLSALVSKDAVVSAKVNPPKVLKHKFATYPLRAPSEAFEDLKNGQGVFNKPISSSNITIIEVTLGYVESETTSDFLQPVYIFKTADRTLGFVGAVSEKWID